MDEQPLQPRTPRRNKQQLLELIEQFDKTPGITIKDFCKLNKVTQGSFYTARKRHRAALKKQSSGFIAIKRPAADQTVATLFAEVKGIKLYQHVPVDYLKALIS
jgi:hypothetical protein